MEDELITVCDKCLQASCWQGIFMCEDARDAGTVQKTRAELAALALENSDFWKTDRELAGSNAKAGWAKKGASNRWRQRALRAEACISIAINTCKDVTRLGRFSPAVDPVRWVEGLQAHLEVGDGDV